MIGSKSLSDFLHGNAIPSDWQVAWIPIQELIPGHNAFFGIGLEADRPSTVWVDEVKVREEFKLPLPGGKSWLLTTEVGDKGCNGYIPPLPSHTGANYFSIDFDDMSAVEISESNVPVLASASGKVVFAGANQYNGTYVVLNHDYKEKSNSLETFYLHLEEGSLKVKGGDTVVQGQPLGILGKTGTVGTHIHLGFYYYDKSGLANANVSILQSLQMEGLRLDEYKATCSTYIHPTTGAVVKTPTKYFPSSNTK